MKACLLPKMPIFILRGRGKRKWRGEGGDYSREAIILNISVKGGRLIEGRLLFEEIRYLLVNVGRKRPDLVTNIGPV